MARRIRDIEDIEDELFRYENYLDEAYELIRRLHTNVAFIIATYDADEYDDNVSDAYNHAIQLGTVFAALDPDVIDDAARSGIFEQMGGHRLMEDR